MPRGTELCFSYLSGDALAEPRAARAAGLDFECRCGRCVGEAAAEQRSYAAMLCAAAEDEAFTRLLEEEPAGAAAYAKEWAAQHGHLNEARRPRRDAAESGEMPAYS